VRVAWGNADDELGAHSGNCDRSIGRAGNEVPSRHAFRRLYSLSLCSDLLQATQNQSVIMQDQDEIRMTYAVILKTKVGREVRSKVTHVISESTLDRVWPELGVKDERWDEWRDATRMIDIVPGKHELSLLATIDEGTILFNASALKLECAAVLPTVADEEVRDLLRALLEAATVAVASGGVVAIIPSTEDKVGDQWSDTIDDRLEQENEPQQILAIAIKTQRGRKIQLTVTQHLKQSAWERLWTQLGVTSERWYDWGSARMELPIKPELPTLSLLAKLDFGAPPLDLAALEADCASALLTASDEETRGLL